MVRDKYADKIMELIELGAPVADTRTEVKAILKQYFMCQIADYAEHVAVHQMQLEEQVESVERGGI